MTFNERRWMNDFKWMTSNEWRQMNDIKGMTSNEWSRMNDFQWMATNRVGGQGDFNKSKRGDTLKFCFYNSLKIGIMHTMYLNPPLPNLPTLLFIIIFLNS
jgi:hypothetical protein